jgi:3-oxoacyl-[acyl-carrier protein] reductase
MVKTASQLSATQEINILVHNAGNGDDRYLADVDEEFYEMQTSINMKGIVPYAILFLCNRF